MSDTKITLNDPDGEPKWLALLSGVIIDDPDTNDKKWEMSLQWAYDKPHGPYLTGSLTDEGVHQVIEVLRSTCASYSSKANQHGYEARKNFLLRLVREYAGEDRPWHPASCPEDPASKLQHVRTVDNLRERHPAKNEIHLTVPYPRSKSGNTKLTIVMRDAHVTDWEKPEYGTTVYTAPGVVWINKVGSLTSPTAVTKVIEQDATLQKAMEGCVSHAISQGWNPKGSAVPTSLIESIDAAVKHWATFGKYPSDVLSQSKSDVLDNVKVITSLRASPTHSHEMDPTGTSSRVEYRKHTGRKKGGIVIWRTSDVYKDETDGSFKRMAPEDSKKMVQGIISQMERFHLDGYPEETMPSTSGWQARQACLFDMLRQCSIDWANEEYHFEDITTDISEVQQWTYAAGKLPSTSKPLSLTVKFNSALGE